MEEQKIVQRNLALQKEWYGEPLGDRVRRLVVAFDVSQANLADVLGISAPMLSQVMSGRRAKIGNPAVLARLIMLERKVLTPEVVSGERGALQEALDDVRQSRPTVSRDSVPVGIGPGADEAAALTVIREAAEEDGDLDKAARLLDDEFPALADLVRRADENF
ncbi:MAG: XRE family transcriptional regulator [Pseudonocardiaceae bacterium]|nr:XRE family transcriptional regulator [Pseudonocardiaceae bacterium]